MTFSDPLPRRACNTSLFTACKSISPIARDAFFDVNTIRIRQFSVEDYLSDLRNVELTGSYAAHEFCDDEVLDHTKLAKFLCLPKLCTLTLAIDHRAQSTIPTRQFVDDAAHFERLACIDVGRFGLTLASTWLSILRPNTNGTSQVFLTNMTLAAIWPHAKRLASTDNDDDVVDIEEFERLIHRYCSRQPRVRPESPCLPLAMDLAGLLVTHAKYRHCDTETDFVNWMHNAA